MANGAQLVAQRVAAWNAAHPRAPLDAKAVLAVAAQEGLGGGIGDGGHAYGPFQLNNAGGVLTGIYQGAHNPHAQAWAWSPAGIDWALSHIASVAAGQQGGRAVENIVRRFERPAAPDPEVSRALAAYGGKVSSGYTPTGATSTPGRAYADSGAALADTSGMDKATLALLLLSRTPFSPPPAPGLGTTAAPLVHLEDPSGVQAEADATLRRAADYLATAKGAFTNPGFAQHLYPGLPATTIGQAASGSHTPTPGAGDLVFFGRGAPTHQGVVLGGNQFLHGTDGGRVLRISSLAAQPYSSSLVGARSVRP